MKNLTLVIISILLFYSCGEKFLPEYHVEQIYMDSDIGAALASKVKPLCELTGLKIVKPMYECQKIRYCDYTFYYCEAILRFFDEPIPYRILMDTNKRVFEFGPIESFDIEYAVGYDILPSGRERQKVLDTIERVNSTIGNRYFGKGAVQKADKYYIVSFLALPEEEIRKRQERGELVFDPYFTFFLTENMTVFQIICGGWCFNQMNENDTEA